eukprot:TRINITY_DN48565_c0_g1_i1.p4 TRINITY_DN48565_c0_g1~~TRINITY_DN48565_c0_g1_i1.p4  ORF type:complete len:108 (-),score=34.29 TRINITY_DN48565_c0_g1_i1:23-346(-)
MKQQRQSFRTCQKDKREQEKQTFLMKTPQIQKKFFEEFFYFSELQKSQLKQELTVEEESLKKEFYSFIFKEKLEKENIKICKKILMDECFSQFYEENFKEESQKSDI